MCHFLFYFSHPCVSVSFAIRPNSIRVRGGRGSMTSTTLLKHQNTLGHGVMELSFFSISREERVFCAERKISRILLYNNTDDKKSVDNSLFKKKKKCKSESL